MKNKTLFSTGLVLSGSLIVLMSCVGENAFNSASVDDDGWHSIFDGESLDGWEGDPVYWRVENGAIVGEVTEETRLDRNSFLIWRKGLTRDFEIEVEYRVSAQGNSGINYRSQEVEGVPYALRGYQADLDGRNSFTGMNYEERRRTTIAAIGEKVLLPDLNDTYSLDEHIHRNQWGPRIVRDSLGDREELTAHINQGWNDYHIVAKGNRLKHYVNGVLMSDVTDEDTVSRRFEGLLGVQVHVGPPMKVEYRNFRMKHIDP